MLTEILLMTFVKSFQWYVDCNPFNDFCEELAVSGMLTEILLMTFVKSFQWYVD